MIQRSCFASPSPLLGRPFGDGLRYAGAPRSSLAWPGGAPVVVRIPVEKQRGKMRKSVKRKPGLDTIRRS